MFFAVLCFQLFVRVLCGAPPAPPQNIQVSKWLLTWTPERNVTYSVQYSSFDSGVWAYVPACVHISSNSCDVTFTKAKDEHDCIKLRVRAERRGLNSVPVEACSTHGDTCTPNVTLSARPGSLIVSLSGDHCLADYYGDHAKHRVYYGKEGEPLKNYKDDVSSTSISGLQEGQRYCIQVQYIYFDIRVGLPSCTQCALIPESKKDPDNAEIIAGVVAALLLIVLITVLAYVLLFHRGTIKQWLRPPYNIPQDFLLEPFPEHRRPVCTSSPSEEHYSVLSSVTPE